MTSNSNVHLHAFISYVRADAKSFAVRLHHDLQKYGLNSWLDVESISSGRTFLAAITEAIERADYFILVNTPGAISSPFCRDEWDKAIRAYKPIIPLVLMGDYSKLPLQANVYLNDARDFRNHGDQASYEHELNRLVDQLRFSPTAAGVLVGAPNLPIHYLERPYELKKITDNLTSHKTKLDNSPTKLLGIHGR